MKKKTASQLVLSFHYISYSMFIYQFSDSWLIPTGPSLSKQVLQADRYLTKLMFESKRAFSPNLALSSSTHLSPKFLLLVFCSIMLVTPQGAQLSIHYFKVNQLCCTSLTDLIQDYWGVEREEKSPAPGRNRTHDLKAFCFAGICTTAVIHSFPFNQ